MTSLMTCLPTGWKEVSKDRYSKLSLLTKGFNYVILSILIIILREAAMINLRFWYSQTCFYFAPVWLRSIAISVSVCPSVCSLAYLIHRRFKFHLIFFCGSDLLWRKCNKLCTFGLGNYVMFSHNGANRLYTKTTCMFRPVRQVAALVGHQRTLFGWVRHLVTPGANSAVSGALWTKFW